LLVLRGELEASNDQLYANNDAAEALQDDQQGTIHSFLHFSTYQSNGFLLSFRGGSQLFSIEES
jgi:hypothetical protein